MEVEEDLLYLHAEVVRAARLVGHRSSSRNTSWRHPAPGRGGGL